MSTCAGTSTEAEVDLEAGGLRRIDSTGSMQRESRAPKHAKDKRDPSNVIYPRRKVGEDVRNSNQVVVTRRSSRAGENSEPCLFLVLLGH